MCTSHFNIYTNELINMINDFVHKIKYVKVGKDMSWN